VEAEHASQTVLPWQIVSLAMLLVLHALSVRLDLPLTLFCIASIVI
jgi:hypothetical protein